MQKKATGPLAAEEDTPIALGKGEDREDLEANWRVIERAMFILSKEMYWIVNQIPSWTIFALWLTTR